MQTENLRRAPRYRGWRRFAAILGVVALCQPVLLVAQAAALPLAQGAPTALPGQSAPTALPDELTGLFGDGTICHAGGDSKQAPAQESHRHCAVCTAFAQGHGLVPADGAELRVAFDPAPTPGRSEQPFRTSRPELSLSGPRAPPALS